MKLVLVWNPFVFNYFLAGTLIPGTSVPYTKIYYGLTPYMTLAEIILIRLKMGSPGDLVHSYLMPTYLQEFLEIPKYSCLKIKFY